MKLKTLFKNIAVEIKGSKETEITGLSNDSRIAAPGNLFIAKKGSALNGVDFIPKAVDAGASAILTDLYDPFLKVAQVIVKNPGALEAMLAGRFYQEPSQELFLVGVTGTKGKTTTSYLVHHLLGPVAGLVGTVETVVGTERRNSQLTTHSAIQNQKILREMVARGCKSASLEISSHGLDQGRADEIAFDAAIFTNLFPDHLDYHPSIEEYAAAKKLLFKKLDQSGKKNKRALFNADSSWTEFMREGISSPAWTFGCQASADIQASEIRFDGQGTRFKVAFEGATQEFHLSLMGRFNVYNALGAIGIGLHRGMDLAAIARALSSFRTAPGRLEQVPNERGVWVFVDYAHNGEALENVLSALREVARKRILCLFGCGGNRDPQRRWKMAKAAEKYADVVIVTSDNPRKEDPQAIVDEILTGFENRSKTVVELDRKLAIHKAISLAEPEDIVLIAGKGHEKVQIFAHRTVPFDDVAIAKEALQK